MYMADYTAKHKPKLIIMSGSINSGKTTTSKYLVERLNTDL